MLITHTRSPSQLYNQTAHTTKKAINFQNLEMKKNLFRTFPCSGKKPSCIPAV